MVNLFFTNKYKDQKIECFSTAFASNQARIEHLTFMPLNHEQTEWPILVLVSMELILVSH